MAGPYMLVLAVCFALGNCTFSRGIAHESDSKQISKPEKNRRLVNPFWQKRMQAELTKFSCPLTAYGLFSYGGWVDQGQWFVVEQEQDKKQTFLYVEPAGKQIKQKRTLESDEWKIFRSSIVGVDKLADLHKQVLDGVEFEFVIVRCDQAGKMEIRDRLYMNNPGINSSDAPYQSLVNGFRGLLRKEQ